MSDFILLAHILGAATWFGTHVYLETLFATAFRSDDPSVTGGVFDRVAVANSRLMPAASVVTIVFGIWLVIDRPAWDFEMMFVALGFALAVAGAAIGIFLLTPKEKEIREIAAEHGLGSNEVITAAKKLATIGHAQSAIVAIALIIMVLKPGI